jgi:hypothetical protein
MESMCLPKFFFIDFIFIFNFCELINKNIFNLKREIVRIIQNGNKITKLNE